MRQRHATWDHCLERADRCQEAPRHPRWHPPHNAVAHPLHKIHSSRQWNSSGAELKFKLQNRFCNLCDKNRKKPRVEARILGCWDKTTYHRNAPRSPGRGECSLLQWWAVVRALDDGGRIHGPPGREEREPSSLARHRSQPRRWSSHLDTEHQSSSVAYLRHTNILDLSNSSASPCCNGNHIILSIRIEKIQKYFLSNNRKGLYNHDHGDGE